MTASSNSSPEMGSAPALYLQNEQPSIIENMDTIRSSWVTGVISPKPTVKIIVSEKYKATTSAEEQTQTKGVTKPKSHHRYRPNHAHLLLCVLRSQFRWAYEQNHGKPSSWPPKSKSETH